MATLELGDTQRLQISRPDLAGAESPYWNANALLCQGVSNIFAAQAGAWLYLFAGMRVLARRLIEWAPARSSCSAGSADAMFLEGDVVSAAEGGGGSDSLSAVVAAISTCGRPL